MPDKTTLSAPAAADPVETLIGAEALQRLHAAGYAVVPQAELDRQGRMAAVIQQASNWALRLVALFAATVEPGPHPLQGRVQCPVCDWDQTVQILAEDPAMATVVDHWLTAAWLDHLMTAHRTGWLGRGR